MCRSSPRLRRTMSRPRKTTLPDVISPGGESSWAIPNSIVDLPQPDSPTMPTNSRGCTEKLTFSTARTSAASVRYSIVRPRTSSSGSGTPPPSRRTQCGVADLVKGIVQQREAGSEQPHRCGGCDLPPDVPAGLNRCLLLGVVEHRPPHLLAAVAKAEELQARGETDDEHGQGEERSRDQRRHRGDDLHEDDAERPLAADLGGDQEVTVAQREALRAQLPGLEGPARDAQHDGQ